MAATILEALNEHFEWHADVSFDGSRRIYKLDMRLADAFRAMLYRKTTQERMRWIEREVYNPSNGPLDAYQKELCQWWTDLHADLYRPENDNKKETA